MKKIIRKILFGETPVSEYCTVTVEGEIREKVYFNFGQSSLDVSAIHWLLCLNPLVFGIWFGESAESGPPGKNSLGELRFVDDASKGKTVALAKVVVRDSIQAIDGTLVLAELKKTSIHHVSYLKSLLLYYKYYKKPEQDFEMLKSFSTAYSYPRRVRVVSFREGDWFNIFPMDLVGDIPLSKKYVFGLRHSNVTLSRIIETGKICVSEVPYDHKSVIYQLGKHHKEALSEGELPFKIVNSEFFGFPIPEWASRYKEVRIVNSMNLGSHMLLWGEEANEKYIRESSGHLFHIHFLHYLHQKKKGLQYPLI
jgi:flavin reductase (DIM6/NTAB) family NADH-FMN oxidoreductase RutF